MIGAVVKVVRIATGEETVVITVKSVAAEEARPLPAPKFKARHHPARRNRTLL